MSTTIADILQAKQPQFAHEVENMERLCGRPGVDIKLSLKLKQSHPRAIKKLGLDPGDTSGEEFYEALKHRLQSDDKRIAEMIGAGGNDTPETINKKTIGYIDKKISMPDAWQLKGTFIRKVLKKYPPKTLMKATGYRSVDSLLKREQLAEVIALSRSVDGKWYEKVSEEYKKAVATDIEQKPVRVLSVKSARIGRIQKTVRINGGQVSSVNELGSIVIIPAASRFRADVIASVVVLIEALREIKLTSSLLKFLTVRKDFGKLAFELINGGYKSSDNILPVSWSAICHFAYKNRIVPEFVQPHITQEDLDVSPVVTDFCLTFPELNFWFGLDSLAVLDDNLPVSCNLIDVVLNTCNDVPYKKRVNDYIRRSLADEFYGNYLVFPEAQKELLKFKNLGTEGIAR
jgi:hypothetical protein